MKLPPLIVASLLASVLVSLPANSFHLSIIR